VTEQLGGFSLVSTLLLLSQNSINTTREHVITESGPMFLAEDVAVGKFAMYEYVESVASNRVIVSLLNERNYRIATGRRGFSHLNRSQENRLKFGIVNGFWKACWNRAIGMGNSKSRHGSHVNGGASTSIVEDDMHDKRLINLIHTGRTLSVNRLGEDSELVVRCTSTGLRYLPARSQRWPAFPYS
jgi:hypothetical protein